MVWLGMILAMLWAQSLQGWSEWGFRITVLSSLGANLVVAILARRRRRLASGRFWRWADQLFKLCFWLACQVADVAATSAIGNLSLSGSDASEGEKQVVAFWATFLLLHLGGPDNLSAYALEDNKISKRQWIEMFFRIVGGSYAIYNNTHPGGRSWALLLAASVVMLVAGAIRYLERATAQGEANLDSMQEDASSRSSEDDIDEKMVKSLNCRIESTKRRGWSLRDGEALLLAQDLFPIWRHALVDSSVNPKSERQKASERIVTELDWDSMCKVAEMELSLIYEFLYTKAILAQTCFYYLIHLLSPLFTAAAAFLFFCWQQQQQGVGGSYVRITYALLAITFVMDVVWLLRALGSTWAYAYLQEHAPAWLRHQALHASLRWWCSLHRIIVSLDPLRLLFCRNPVRHRRWSRTIGRYNLLDECTATSTICWSHCPESWPWSGAGDDTPKEMRYLSKLPPCVMELVFKRVRKILQEAVDTEKNKVDKDMYNRQDVRKKWGQKANPLPTRSDEDYTFGQEFEEDVLLWHVATCMALPHKQNAKHALAVEVLSEYMMFLVAVRRQMLPGLVLHSQLQVTRKTLKDLWAHENSQNFLSSNQESSMNNKEKLAWLLRQAKPLKDSEIQPKTDVVIPGTEGTQLVLHAAKLYFGLSDTDPTSRIKSRVAQWPPQIAEKTMEIIFNVWVDKLIYAAVNCRREAHANQLSAGGDWTTVVWMLIQHAGPFCMVEAPPDLWIALPPRSPPPPPPSPPRTAPPSPPAPTPPPPYCPMCPPCYHPSYPPTWPPCYDPSWRPACPWCPQCPHQHEKPGDKPEVSRGDEDADSSSDEDSSEE